MEKIDNEPAVVEILFAVTHEALRDRLELEQGDLLASAQYEVVKLLRMGRRFRYDIVEPWQQALDSLTPRPRQSPERVSKFKSKCLRYLNRLSQLEREGEEGKHNTYSASAATIGCLPQYLEEIWRQYYDIDVRTHVDNIDTDLVSSLAGISSALKQYRDLNKKFMLIALEGYMRKVEQVKPEDLQRDDVLPDAFGGKRFSSAATADGLIGESVINLDRVDHAVARKRQNVP